LQNFEKSVRKRSGSGSYEQSNLGKTKISTPYKTACNRDILLEATFSQKVWATSISTGNQGGEATLDQKTQFYRVWNKIEIFQISDNIFIMVKTIVVMK